MSQLHNFQHLADYTQEVSRVLSLYLSGDLTVDLYERHIKEMLRTYVYNINDYVILHEGGKLERRLQDNRLRIYLDLAYFVSNKKDFSLYYSEEFPFKITDNGGFIDANGESIDFISYYQDTLLIIDVVAYYNYINRDITSYMFPKFTYFPLDLGHIANASLNTIAVLLKQQLDFFDSFNHCAFTINDWFEGEVIPAHPDFNEEAPNTVYWRKGVFFNTRRDAFNLLNFFHYANNTEI